ncbi:MAG TPA: isoprenylcysteine carboxylmethyltransferase family protein [Pseudonocardiaceae bacterium]
MRRSTAALGSAAFFVAAPGTVVGLIPWLITHWEFHQPGPYWVVAQVIGAVLICVGLVPAVSAFVEFVKAGGTPMPIAPTQRLVVSGFNRYVRNPMYFGLVLAILGQALLFASLGVLIYAAVAWVVPAAFVRWYEEPTLARQFGAEYEAYRRAVPAWWPLLRPWTPSGHGVPETQ